jgi:DNA ligase-1
MFANITLSEDGEVRIESRNGSPFPLDELSELVADVKKKYVKGYQTHGELLVGIKKMSGIALLTRQEGNGILNKILKGGELDPQYVVLYEAWDMIPAAKATTKGKWALRYAERFANLTQMIGYTDASSLVRLIETRVVTSYADAQAHYAEALSRGLEGTIIKHPEMEWKDGTSKHQVKMKLEFEVDLEVIGYNEGKNKYVGMLGSLECATSDRKLIVNVAGFTDAQRKEIWETKNMKIVTVKSNSVMPPTNKDTYSLFLPIFVEERLDKKTADSLERVLAQFEAATA